MVNSTRKEEDDNEDTIIRQLQSELMSRYNRRKWLKMTPEQRTKATKSAVKASLASRAKDPPKVRSARASKAASSISPEAARNRAIKAWETKRKKAEEKIRTQIANAKK